MNARLISDDNAIPYLASTVLPEGVDEKLLDDFRDPSPDDVEEYGTLAHVLFSALKQDSDPSRIGLPTPCPPPTRNIPVKLTPPPISLPPPAVAYPLPVPPPMISGVPPLAQAIYLAPTPAPINPYITPFTIASAAPSPTPPVSRVAQQFQKEQSQAREQEQLAREYRHQEEGRLLAAQQEAQRQMLNEQEEPDLSALDRVIENLEKQIQATTAVPQILLPSIPLPPAPHRGPVNPDKYLPPAPHRGPVQVDKYGYVVRADAPAPAPAPATATNPMDYYRSMFPATAGSQPEVRRQQETRRADRTRSRSPRRDQNLRVRSRSPRRRRTRSRSRERRRSRSRERRRRSRSKSRGSRRRSRSKSREHRRRSRSKRLRESRSKSRSQGKERRRVEAYSGPPVPAFMMHPADRLFQGQGGKRKERRGGDEQDSHKLALDKTLKLIKDLQARPGDEEMAKEVVYVTLEAEVLDDGQIKQLTQIGAGSEDKVTGVFNKTFFRPILPSHMQEYDTNLILKNQNNLHSSLKLKYNEDDSSYMFLNVKKGEEVLMNEEKALCDLISFLKKVKMDKHVVVFTHSRDILLPLLLSKLTQYGLLDSFTSAVRGFCDFCSVISNLQLGGVWKETKFSDLSDVYKHILGKSWPREQRHADGVATLSGNVLQKMLGDYQDYLEDEVKGKMSVQKFLTACGFKTVLDVQLEFAESLMKEKALAVQMLKEGRKEVKELELRPSDRPGEITIVTLKKFECIEVDDLDEVEEEGIKEDDYFETGTKMTSVMEKVVIKSGFVVSVKMKMDNQEQDVKGWTLVAKNELFGGPSDAIVVKEEGEEGVRQKRILQARRCGIARQILEVKRDDLFEEAVVVVKVLNPTDTDVELDVGDQVAVAKLEKGPDPDEPERKTYSMIKEEAEIAARERQEEEERRWEEETRKEEKALKRKKNKKKKLCKTKDSSSLDMDALDFEPVASDESFDEENVSSDEDDFLHPDPQEASMEDVSSSEQVEEVGTEQVEEVEVEQVELSLSEEEREVEMQLKLVDMQLEKRRKSTDKREKITGPENDPEESQRKGKPAETETNGRGMQSETETGRACDSRDKEPEKERRRKSRDRSRERRRSRSRERRRSRSREKRRSRSRDRRRRSRSREYKEQGRRRAESGEQRARGTSLSHPDHRAHINEKNASNGLVPIQGNVVERNKFKLTTTKIQVVLPGSNVVEVAVKLHVPNQAIQLKGKVLEVLEESNIYLEASKNKPRGWGNQWLTHCWVKKGSYAAKTDPIDPKSPKFCLLEVNVYNKSNNEVTIPKALEISTCQIRQDASQSFTLEVGEPVCTIRMGEGRVVHAVTRHDTSNLDNLANRPCFVSQFSVQASAVNALKTLHSQITVTESENIIKLQNGTLGVSFFVRNITAQDVHIPKGVALAKCRLLPHTNQPPAFDLGSYQGTPCLASYQGAPSLASYQGPPTPAPNQEPPPPGEEDIMFSAPPLILPTPPSEEELKGWSVKRLKSCLLEAGLHQYGLKADLVARLHEYYVRNPEKMLSNQENALSGRAARAKTDMYEPTGGAGTSIPVVEPRGQHKVLPGLESYLEPVPDTSLPPPSLIPPNPWAPTAQNYKKSFAELGSDGFYYNDGRHVPVLGAGNGLMTREEYSKNLDNRSMLGGAELLGPYAASTNSSLDSFSQEVPEISEKERSEYADNEKIMKKIGEIKSFEKKDLEFFTSGMSIRLLGDVVVEGGERKILTITLSELDLFSSELGGRRLLVKERVNSKRLLTVFKQIVEASVVERRAQVEVLVENHHNYQVVIKAAEKYKLIRVYVEKSINDLDHQFGIPEDDDFLEDMEEYLEKEVVDAITTTDIVLKPKTYHTEVCTAKLDLDYGPSPLVMVEKTKASTMRIGMRKMVVVPKRLAFIKMEGGEAKVPVRLYNASKSIMRISAKTPIAGLRVQKPGVVGEEEERVAVVDRRGRQGELQPGRYSNLTDEQLVVLSWEERGKEARRPSLAKLCVKKGQVTVPLGGQEAAGTSSKVAGTGSLCFSGVRDDFRVQQLIKTST